MHWHVMMCLPTQQRTNKHDILKHMNASIAMTCLAGFALCSLLFSLTFSSLHMFANGCTPRRHNDCLNIACTAIAWYL